MCAGPESLLWEIHETVSWNMEETASSAVRTTHRRLDEYLGLRCRDDYHEDPERAAAS